MNRRARAIALLSAACLSGCAMLGPGAIEDNTPGVMNANARAPAPAAALAAAAPGSSRQQIEAALGRADVIRFDSGWEVWVYRWPGTDRSTRAATEVVVLFDPQGIVRKSRLRPGQRS